MNEDEKKAQQEAMTRIMNEVKQLLSDRGPEAAVEFIEGQDDLGKTVNTYNNLIFELYNKEKNLKWLVPVANAGITFCLGKSKELASQNAELSTKLKSVAKALSFNLASFTWPGWDEKGIVITQADLDAGLEAAKLNLQLVEELGADPGQMSNSHWSVGAHYLARKTPADFDKAKKSFESALDYGKQAGSRESELMNAGYIVITRVLAGEDARSDLDDVVKELNDLGTGDAKFFAKQIEDVLEVFSGS